MKEKKGKTTIMNEEGNRVMKENEKLLNKSSLE